jgi:hypothetical protein
MVMKELYLKRRINNTKKTYRVFLKKNLWGVEKLWI